MKRRKLLSLILAAVLSVGTFSGCSNSGNSKATSDNSNSNEIITINWMPQNDKPMDEDSPVTAALEKRFNVKLNYVYMDRNKEIELLNVRIASGDIPDVMRLASDDRYRNFIDQGALAEIPEDLLQKKAPNLYSLTSKNAKESGISNVWNFAKQDGKLYGIPMLNLNGSYSCPTIWRDDWAKNVGVTKIPETLTEAEDLFYKFVKNDPDKNGKNDTYAISSNFMQAVFGAYLTEDASSIHWDLVNGKVVPSAARPETKEAYKLLAKWYKDGLIDPEFITGENKGQYWASSVVFQNGKIGASCPGNSYHVSPPNPDDPDDKGSVNYQNFKSLQPEGSYLVSQGLKGPSGKPGKTTTWGSFTGVEIVLGKNVDKKKMDKILEMFEASVGNFDDFLLIQRGVKDKTYTAKKVGSNDYYTYIGEAADVKAAKVIGTDSGGIGYLTGNNFDFTKKLNAYTFAYSDKYAKFATEYANPILGTLPSQIQYQDAINKMMTQNHIEFITGKLSIDEWDKKLEELNKAGLTQLTKEANDWYTAHMK